DMMEQVISIPGGREPGTTGPQLCLLFGRGKEGAAYGGNGERCAECIIPVPHGVQVSDIVRDPSWHE
ncbi:MAG: hypothetical protein ACK56I_10885, partial [bacterium]